MKKFILSTLLAGMIILSGGCDNSNSNSNSNNDNNTSHNNSKLKATEEILQADHNSYNIQFGNTVITFPTTLKDVLSTGAVLKNDIDPDTTIVEKNGTHYLELEFDGYTYTMVFYNLSNQKQFLKDCVNEMYPYGQDIDISNNIYPKGVKTGMSISEVEKLWGTDYEIHDLDLYLYDYFGLTVDPVTKTVLDIGMGCQPHLVEKQNSSLDK